MQPRRARLTLLGVLAALSAGLAYGAESPEGIRATITDTYGFEITLGSLGFRVDPEDDSGDAVTLDHIPLAGDDEEARLWLAQVATAEFALNERGQVAVKAALQGEEADEVAGVVADPARCAFVGKVVGGEGTGGPVQLPLAEVRALVNLTEYVPPEQRALAVPMPGPADDVLWVASSPTGAEVFVRSLDARQPAERDKYHRLGATPVRAEVPPGRYAIRVYVPPRLAETLEAAEEIDESANPFEPDGWQQTQFDMKTKRIEAVTYVVRKRQGRAVTVIALFQRRGLSLEDVVEDLPAGDRYRFTDRKIEGVLLRRRVPKDDAALILEALHRAGKIVWHGAKQSLIIELRPGERGWSITPGVRPRRTRPQGNR